MPPTNTVRTRADWVQILEAAVAEEPDDRRWAEGVLETARPVFPRASMMGLLVVPSEDRLVEDSIHVMPEVRAGDAERHLLQLANVPDGGFRMFMHPPVPVTTHGEILRAASPDLKAFMRDVAPARAYRDAVGLVTHPVPNVTVVLWAGHDHELLLSRHERELLMRVAAHIEAGYRARKSLRSVKAVLAEDGRLLSRDEDAPAAGALETYGQRIRSARSRASRRNADAIDLWPALLEGRLSLVPRGSSASRRYEVIENAPDAMKLRALTTPERLVLDACAHGLSNKLIAYSLGLSPSVVSTRLATAAAKLGVASRLELLRVASTLAGTRGRDQSDADLSASEREVLELLERGLSNKQIAALRSRSTRTIANQVAALLRKTKTSSRRELIARAAPRSA